MNAPRTPHLEGYMVSRRGEFRLVALPGARTRLEGSTWYTLAIYPEGYWMIYGDALLHLIHGRVLEHIKRDVRRYVKRERGKSLPPGATAWDFACRVGADEATAASVPLQDLSRAIDAAASAGAGVFVEIHAHPVTGPGRDAATD